MGASPSPGACLIGYSGQETRRLLTTVSQDLWLVKENFAGAGRSAGARYWQTGAVVALHLAQAVAAELLEEGAGDLEGHHSLADDGGRRDGTQVQPPHGGPGTAGIRPSYPWARAPDAETSASAPARQSR